MSLLEMTIDSIRVSMMNYQHVVILKEKNTDRYLPIWIGPSESDAISVKLQNIHLSRPLTHDLLKNTILALESFSGATVSQVIVNDLRADTFYAQIVFEFKDGPLPVTLSSEPQNFKNYNKDSYISITWQDKKFITKLIDNDVFRENLEANKKIIELTNENGLTFEIKYDTKSKSYLLSKIKLDSRPSDAIALAVRMDTKIFVDELVLDKAGIILDKETGKPLPFQKEGVEGRNDSTVNEEELKKLKETAFYDFINNLDLDDLGKHKS